MIDKFDKTPLIFKRSIINNGFNSTLLNNESLRDNTLIFSKEVKTQKVCNQHQSGRCWIFAGLNILREKVANKILSDYPEVIEKTIEEGVGETGAQFTKRCISLALSLYWETKVLTK